MVAQVTPITDLTERLTEDLPRLLEAKSAADGIGDAGQRAEAYADQVKPLFSEVRASIDKLEGLVDDKIWADAQVPGTALSPVNVTEQRPSICKIAHV